MTNGEPTEPFGHPVVLPLLAAHSPVYRQHDDSTPAEMPAGSILGSKVRQAMLWDR